jgi:hypothetical protein
MTKGKKFFFQHPTPGRWSQCLGAETHLGPGTPGMKRNPDINHNLTENKVVQIVGALDILLATEEGWENKEKCIKKLI